MGPAGAMRRSKGQPTTCNHKKETVVALLAPIVLAVQREKRESHHMPPAWP